ncbi:hypothetical protein ECE50_028330 [Chitinophaga sp. Mgbs1]|uniref:Uncharacterized protein n=1 Tax=Chitinophaga solisilvae TaxID=1233460 RepID=A0A433WKF5_9BACT|nr:hypothetical protein [Chitinophaga solisilvae]
MKKAKILLAAVAVLATVGGALAFKTTDTKVLYFQDPINQQCTIKQNKVALTQNPAVPLTRASIASTTLPCPLTRVTTLTIN